MDQAVGIGLAARLLAPALASMAGVVAKAHGGMLDNGAAQLLQQHHTTLALWSVARAGYKDNAVLQVMHLVAQLIRQDTLDFAAGGLRRRAALRIEILRPLVASQQDRGRLAGGEAEGR